MEPQLPLTVPRSLWDAMAVALGEPFADSYLSGARLYGDRLAPRGETAWQRLDRNRVVRKLLGELGITLDKPLPPPAAMAA